MQAENSMSALAVPVLQNTMRHQRERQLRYRYEPTVVYMLAERARARGVDLVAAEGPWRVGVRPLPSPGRHGLAVIPLVTDGNTEIMVDTIEHAQDVAGLLNWCGVQELTPVPDLTPPATREPPAAERPPRERQPSAALQRQAERSW